jgi:hypothetical protein
LHPLVYGFGCDDEQDLFGRGDDYSLLGNIVGLTLESKLGKMVDLREEVEGKIRLLESNFITLVQENFPEPRLKV